MRFCSYIIYIIFLPLYITEIYNISDILVSKQLAEDSSSLLDIASLPGNYLLLLTLFPYKYYYQIPFYFTLYIMNMFPYHLLVLYPRPLYKEYVPKFLLLLILDKFLSIISIKEKTLFYHFYQNYQIL